MKTRNYFFTILTISLLSTSTFAQSGLQKTLISSILPGESTMVFLDLPGEVEVEVWDRNYIKVEIDVQTNLKNEEVFNYLNESGRYHVTKDFNLYYFMVLNLSNTNEEVTVNKIALQENFKFKVFVPWDIDFEAGDAKSLQTKYDFDVEEGNVLVSHQIKQ